MKKSDKKFAVTVDGKKTDVGTRSGVANFVRELLGKAEAGKDITLTVTVEAVPVEAKPAKAEAPAAAPAA